MTAAALLAAQAPLLVAAVITPAAPSGPLLALWASASAWCARCTSAWG